MDNAVDDAAQQKDLTNAHRGMACAAMDARRAFLL